MIGSLAAVACSATVPVGQGAGLRARRSAPRAASAALYETCDRWSEPDDYRLSLEETVEQSERRRARWPCSRLLELLGPGISRVG